MTGRGYAYAFSGACIASPLAWGASIFVRAYMANMRRYGYVPYIFPQNLTYMRTDGIIGRHEKKKGRKAEER